MGKINDCEAKPRLLDNIESPADLRKLDLSELPQVCAEIREFLIKTCSENPGHFASNMGSVELTVAMHYVFDTPYDRIVWDVGHQAYGHKLLTGRRDRFDTNRKFGGISGFPNPDESEYDTFTAGHASNSISAALGMAIATRLKNETPKRNVVAVIGDASVSGGLAFEGINNAANTPNNLLIILNDNDMSIDRNVGSLNSHMAHITTSPAYNKWRFRLYRALRKAHLVGDRGRGAILRFNNSLKSLLGREQNIFEGLNIRYFGPFDGHDVIKIVRVLTDIRDMEGPRILHLRTTKGKGFEPAEKEPWKWHAPGKFNPETGIRDCDIKKSTTVVPKYQEVFGNTLLELAKENPRIVGVTAAMLSGTSMEIVQKEMPERVFDVGISEGHAVTFAGGLAKDGMQPFVAIYSSFLQRAYDNIIHDVAIQKLPVTLCIDRAGLVGEDGVTHHGAYDMAYLRTVPNLIVSAPSDEHVMRNLMYTAATGKYGPFAIRYPRGGGKMVSWKSEMQEIPVGKGRKLRDGSQVAVLSIGTVMSDVAEAVAMAVADGKDVAHYDMIFLKPIDEEILKEVADKNCTVITVEDGTVNGGLGGAVSEWLSSNGLMRKVIRLGIPDDFVTHGSPEQLKKLCGFDKDSIYQTIVNA